jgi:branched-chain amino acid aminotransferase
MLNYDVYDNCSLTIGDIETADEIFLTNAIEGIKWILAFKNKRYYNKISKILTEKLNEIAFPD